jgi:hypothetical protein
MEVWQEVGAVPPLKRVVPGVPWHPWQNDRSCFAVNPWNCGLGSRQAVPTAWGAAVVPWHSVLLKHPGGVPAAAGVAGWFAGLFGDPGKWHCAQTGALDVFVSACVYVGPRQGCAGCGAFATWQRKQDSFDPPPAKLLPWQIWQEAKPELPGAFFAATPWFWAAGGVTTQPATGPWWQPAGFPKQETFEVPPERSAPWHSMQELLPPLAM